MLLHEGLAGDSKRIVVAACIAPVLRQTLPELRSAFEKADVASLLRDLGKPGTGPRLKYCTNGSPVAIGLSSQCNSRRGLADRESGLQDAVCRNGLALREAVIPLLQRGSETRRFRQIDFRWRLAPPSTRRASGN